MRVRRVTTMVGLGAGAGLAYATDRYVTPAVGPSLRLPLAWAGLVTAALVYPACRRRPRRGLAASVEWLAVAATTAASIAGSRLPPDDQRRAVAGAWASHALFDTLHRRGKRSLIPGWYPAACAGFDLALAGLLMSDRHAAPSPPP
jgi:hypothetical protein